MERTAELMNLRSRVTQDRADKFARHVLAASRKMTALLLVELMDNALRSKLREDDRQRLAPHMMRIDLQLRRG
jgi:hypothetical protein